ncbi:MAG: hypothetical protein NC350_04335 [Corallococcus sp.]|nr:hypothetical protein [Corallococcus sp.]
MEGKRTTALVLGIVGLSLSAIAFFVWSFLGIGGLVCTIIGLNMSVKLRKEENTDSVTTAAFVCNIIGVILSGIVVLYFVIVVLILGALL